MKRYGIATLCATLVLGCIGAAGAAPTVYGPTGLINMPTAQSLSLYQSNVFVNYMKSEKGDLTTKQTNYGVNVGLGNGLEVGATAIHQNHEWPYENKTVSDSNTKAMLNAKWNFLTESVEKPGAAIGIMNVTGEKDIANLMGDEAKSKAAPYIVFSKSMVMPETDYAVSGHIGYIAGSLDNVMVGASAVVNPKLTIMADYINDMSDFSIGARYVPSENIRVDAASVDGQMMVGISYSKQLTK